MRTFFQDPEFQAHFSRYGYIKYPIFTPEQVSELREAYYGLGIETPEAFSYTSGFCSPEVKAHIHAIARLYFLPVIERILINFKPLAYSYITKVSSPQSHLGIHQDWSLVDETAGHTTINIWCPLVPTDAANGNLTVVPGTHNLPRTPPRRRAPSPYLPYAQAYEPLALPLPTQPGEAIIFDNALFHGSPANTKDEIRLVIHAAVIPAEAKPVLFYDTDPGKVEMCEVDEEFFIEQNIMLARSDKVLEVREIPTIDYRGELSRILGMEITAA